MSADNSWKSLIFAVVEVVRLRLVGLNSDEFSSRHPRRGWSSPNRASSAQQRWQLLGRAVCRWMV